MDEYSLSWDQGISDPSSDSHGLRGLGDITGPDTEIAPGYRDGRGNVLEPGRLREVHRLRRTERFTRFSTATGRNLNLMIGLMNGVTSRLGITRSAKEFAFHLYSDLVHRRVTVGRDATALAAASIYAGCRYYSLPFSLEDIARTVLEGTHPAAAKKQVGKAYRVINREMGIKHAVPTPSDYLARYSSELNLDREVENTAREMLHRAMENGTPGGEPASVAAAVIYLASKRRGAKLTQREITDITGVTDTTIRARYRELKRMFQDT